MNHKQRRKVISIDERFQNQKKKKKKAFVSELKRKAKEWGQFALLLFISWLIMKQCQQLPL
ncbi:MAG: hypothetical protein AB8C84_06715 [Oligoflexales bacterium]